MDVYCVTVHIFVDKNNHLKREELNLKCSVVSIKQSSFTWVALLKIDRSALGYNGHEQYTPWPVTHYTH